jgi:hypothetical protein
MGSAWGGSWGERRRGPPIQIVISLNYCNKFCILKSTAQNETTRRALWSAIRSRSQPKGVDKLVAILSDMSARLAKLDWYERVALSRRERAIRAFDAARRKVG